MWILAPKFTYPISGVAAVATAQGKSSILPLFFYNFAPLRMPLRILHLGQPPL